MVAEDFDKENKLRHSFMNNEMEAGNSTMQFASFLKKSRFRTLITSTSRSLTETKKRDSSR